MQSLSSAPPWGREVVKTHCVLMSLRSIKTPNALQGYPMQSLSSAPPWEREVVKTHCALMSFC